MNTRQRSSKAGIKRDALLLALVGIVLYGTTVAPTVLWGDGGHLQLNAVQGILNGSAGSHPAWVWIAHQFTKIPIGDIAWRVNMVSAIFGATTISLVYMILREMHLKRGPSILATLALMVSHTFWSHAVRAEVYTLTLTLMSLLMWVMLRWHHTEQGKYLIGASLILGIGLTVHLIVALYVPALLWLVWRHRDQLDFLKVTACTLAVVIGVSPLVILLIRDTQTHGLIGQEILRWALFSFEGYDFSNAFFDFSVRYFPSDLFQLLAFLGIQFVGPAGVLGIVGAFWIWRTARRDTALYLLFLYVGSVVFAFAYRVGDRYVFYLPSYLPFVVWIGFGMQWITERLNSTNVNYHRKKIWLYAILTILIVGIPIGTYRIAPELVSRGLTFRESRRVPGPGGKYFFLWPPKTGYNDPRVYAEQTLAILPKNAVILIEPNLAEPLKFIQAIEGVRPDVTVQYCCWDLSILEQAEERPIILADVAPEVYPIEQLNEEYEIKPLGSVYLLTRRQ
jgi:hypothetical protein